MVDRSTIRLCALIPVYNHEQAVGSVVDAVLRQNLDCLLVDDGSRPGAAEVLDRLAEAHPERIVLVRHSQNRGKGAAVSTGLRELARLGYSHALQIDADAQHNANDISAFRDQMLSAPDAIVLGLPRYDESVPSSRYYGRYLTHVWVWINTLSFSIGDSMCGFRVYPIDSINALLAEGRFGERMSFDIEILVRAYWAGLSFINLPTRVRYPVDGVSHFDLWRDNLRISAMHAKLFFGMLRRLPRLLARKRRCS